MSAPTSTMPLWKQRSIALIFTAVTAMLLWMTAPSLAKWDWLESIFLDSFESVCLVILLILLCSVTVATASRIQKEKSGSFPDADKLAYVWHIAYLQTVAGLLTLMGILFATYSDSFVGQTSPVSPIFEGLRKNQTRFPLDETFHVSDTVETIDLVFAFDVSGSTNAIANMDTSWLRRTEQEIPKYPAVKDQESMRNAIANSRRQSSNLSLHASKIFLCSSLMANDNTICKNPKRKYALNAYTFSGFSNNITPKPCYPAIDGLEGFAHLILSIGHNPKAESYNSTDFENLISRINSFNPPSSTRNVFRHPVRLVTIFSDFIQSPKEPGLVRLRELVSRTSKRSNMFNLLIVPSSEFHIESDRTEVLHVFKELLNPDQVHILDLSGTSDIWTANFRSENPIRFLINQENFGDSADVLMEYTQVSRPGDFLIRVNSPNEGFWQDFFLNGEPIATNSWDTLLFKNSIAKLTYKGHGRPITPSFSIDLHHVRQMERVNCDVRLQKGLPMEASKILFTVIVLIGIITAGYLVIAGANYLKLKKGP